MEKRDIVINRNNIKTVPDGKYRISTNLYLLVRNNGSTRTYCFRYTINGIRRDFSLGPVAKKSITTAKAEADVLRAKVASGIDPIREKETARKNAQKKDPTFAQYFAEKKEEILEFKGYKNYSSIYHIDTMIDRHVIPKIGSIKVREITTSDIVSVLKPIWVTKNPTACIIRTHLQFIMSMAIRDGYYTGFNPAVWEGAVNTYLRSPVRVHQVEHRPAPSVERLKTLLPTFFVATKYIETKMAIAFIALTALRRNEIAFLKWEEVNFEERYVMISPDRRKDKKPIPFYVPMTDQMEFILRYQKPEKSGFVFKSIYSDVNIHPTNLTKVVRKVSEGDFCMHGFRSTFRDWCADTGVDSFVAEKCLMHGTGTKVEKAYQRSDVFERRVPVMQEWNDVILPMSVLEDFQKRLDLIDADVSTYRAKSVIKQNNPVAKRIERMKRINARIDGYRH